MQSDKTSYNNFFPKAAIDQKTRKNDIVLDRYVLKRI